MRHGTDHPIIVNDAAKETGRILGKKKKKVGSSATIGG